MKQVGWFGLQSGIIVLMLMAGQASGGIADIGVGPFFLIGVLMALQATCLVTVAIWIWQWMFRTSSPSNGNGQGTEILTPGIDGSRLGLGPLHRESSEASGESDELWGARLFHRKLLESGARRRISE